MTEIQWTDAEREAVRDELAHTIIGTGYYSTTVDIDTAREMTDDALAALAPFVAAREAQAAAKVLGRVADGFRDNAVKMRARGGYTAESSAPRHQMCDEVADVLTNEARRIERGESS